VSVDVAVIGGGPAGLAAALWLGRYRRATVVFDSGEYRNRWVDASHGYLGADGIDPAELRASARKDLARYSDVEIREDGVTSVRSAEGGGFAVETERETVPVKRVIIATGVRDAFPEIDNFFDFYGTSVFNCPACDGYEASGKHVVLFGWEPHVIAFATHLLEWARSVTVVTDGPPFEAGCPIDDRIVVYEEDAVALTGAEGQLRTVRLADGREIDADLAFFSIATTPINEFARQLACEINEEGCVIVDENGRTSVDGVYAAGDIVPGPHLVQMAAASGAAAGLDCARSLAGL
jgi:thioredoxin reductase